MSDSDNTGQEEILQVNTPHTEPGLDSDDNTQNKPKKGFMAKIRKLSSRKITDLGGDAPPDIRQELIGDKPTQELTGDETPTHQSDNTDTPKDLGDKALDKQVTDNKAAERKDQLKALGLDDEIKHSKPDKIKQKNESFRKSGLGQAADRLGRNMKTVSGGAEGMTEAALLELALYNLLMLLFELLFGTKKAITKVPDGVNWIRANHNRAHLHSGALRKYAKEDHGKALKDADGLKKDIEALKEERKELKEEKKKFEAMGPGDEREKGLLEVDEKLKENKEKLTEKQDKYDSAISKMAKAERIFKKHGDAEKDEKWQKAMAEYQEVLPKLKEANEKYKADKQTVKDTPFLQRDAKRAELKLDQQKVELDKLKEKELGLYTTIEKLEKKIGKTSAELAEMKKAADANHADELNAPNKGRDKQDKIAEVEKLAGQKIDAMNKAETLNNNKTSLEKDLKEIKELRNDLKKIPDDLKSPEEKAQKIELDKKLAETKGKLINLNGKQASLEQAQETAKTKLKDFQGNVDTLKAKLGEVKYEARLEKLENKLGTANVNVDNYAQVGTDLKVRKGTLETKIAEHANLEADNPKNTPERLEKLQRQLGRVNNQIAKHEGEGKGQIIQNEEKVKGIQSQIAEISAQINPNPEANRAGNTASNNQIPLAEITNPSPNVTPQNTQPLLEVTTGPQSDLTQTPPPRPTNTPPNPEPQQQQNTTTQNDLFSTTSENIPKPLERVNVNPEANKPIIQQAELIDATMIERPPNVEPQPSVTNTNVPETPIGTTQTDQVLPQPEVMPEPESQPLQIQMPKPKTGKDKSKPSLHGPTPTIDRYKAYDSILAGLDRIGDLKSASNEQIMDTFRFMMDEGAKIQTKDNIDAQMEKNTAYRPSMLKSPDENQRMIGYYALITQAYLTTNNKEFSALSVGEKDLLKDIAKNVAQDGSVLKNMTDVKIESAIQRVADNTQQANKRPALTSETFVEPPPRDNSSTTTIKTGSGGGGRK